MLPASDTKNNAVLVLSSGISLVQCDDGVANGTGLWIGAQVLTAFLVSSGLVKSGLRVIELGSGIGFTAISLAKLGCAVDATDIPIVLSKTLVPNVARNSDLPGTVRVRELDWSVAPQHWQWDHPTAIASPTHSPSVEQKLTTPFDMVLSADTIYSTDLVAPLMRSLQAICLQSLAVSSRVPPVYLCLERRDPQLVDYALKEADETWGFTVTRIPKHKVSKAVDKMYEWQKAEWEGVEIYKLVLRKT
uniref:Methyltransferase-domain-containing protein n=1 Tax=Mycena chlorophos TaxID=658473 RepID=A0ABQ0M621_MYCCL|nr:predicted protein [Mycena chlorophos]